jgi:hypothetical protein
MKSKDKNIYLTHERGYVKNIFVTIEIVIARSAATALFGRFCAFSHSLETA